MHPPEEITPTDVTFTTPDGSEHKLQVTMSPTQPLASFTHTLFVNIDSRDKATAYTVASEAFQPKDQRTPTSATAPTAH